MKADADGSAYMDWSKASAYLYYMGVLSGKDLMDLVDEGSIELEIKTK